MNKNYYKLYKEEIEKIRGSKEKPSLLLHVCCAPCSSAVLEKLKDIFNITLFFYNPNISPEKEYNFRLEELKKLLELMNLKNIKIIAPKYDNNEFFDIARGKELYPEGAGRCKDCFYLRLDKTFSYAKENNFDYVTTTLSISPHKNSNTLNEIGLLLEEKYNIKYLVSDFKKENGYKRSCELSEQYDLYRQNFCGCVFSQRMSDCKIKVYKVIPDEARNIREEVFIKEQGFLEEYDEIDNSATHFVYFYKGVPVGTLRLFTLDNPKDYILGRLAVLKNYRNFKIGTILVESAIDYAKEKNGEKIILHSQLHAKDFYKKLGFSEYGEIEYEEDCPHIWMEKILN